MGFNNSKIENEDTPETKGINEENESFEDSDEEFDELN